MKSFDKNVNFFWVSLQNEIFYIINYNWQSVTLILICWTLLIYQNDLSINPLNTRVIKLIPIFHFDLCELLTRVQSQRGPLFLVELPIAPHDCLDVQPKPIGFSIEDFQRR